MNIGIVGVSCAEGEKLIKLLEKSNLNIDNINFFDIKKLDEDFIIYNGKNHLIYDVSEEILKSLDLIFICNHELVTKEKLSSYLNNYNIVLDKSDIDITDDNVCVIIPDINSDLIDKSKIIVNPNSSVIRMALTLYYLRELSEIVRVDATIINNANCEEIESKKGYIEEEFEKELKKIFNYKYIELNPVYIKIPEVKYSFESLVIEYSNIRPIVEIKRALTNSKKFKIVDSFNECSYEKNKAGSEDKFLVQIKVNINNPRIINLLIMSDDLYKGDIANAIKIAEQIIKK